MQLKRKTSRTKKHMTSRIKNKKGGIFVEKKCMRNAFELLGVEDEQLTEQHLEKVIPCFFPKIKQRDLTAMMNNQSKISLDDAYTFLSENDLKTKDPLEDVFHVLDPNDTGFVDSGAVQKILVGLGLKDLTQEDVKLLMETLEFQTHGMVNLDDFRSNAMKSDDTRH